MTLFTKFKKAKEAAVEHKKIAAAQEAKPVTPYKHVPTHAAQDALNAHPTTLKPAELQARIAAARKRRASSYSPSVASRHSVYHACESSRASSRTNSTAVLATGSTTSSVKGKGKSDASIDTVMQRSQSLSHKQSAPMADDPLLSGEHLLSPLATVPLAMPPTVSHRPRPYKTMSSRSSFAQKKSPLSNVSLDEESEDIFSSGSDTSAVSSESSKTIDLKHVDHVSPGPRHFSKPSDGLKAPQVATAPNTKRKSRWSILPRKNVSIAAH